MAERTATRPDPSTGTGAGAPDRAATRRLDLRARPQLLTVPLFFVVVMLAWEFGTAALGVDAYVLPPPSAIAETLADQVQTGLFWTNVRVTAWEAFLGYALGVSVAAVLGLAISQITLVEKTLMPYVVGFQSIPIIALAPLLVVWFGFGTTSKVVMAAIVCFFPMLVNVIEGLRACGQDQIDMLRSFDASRGQIFLKAQLPNALPFIFAGLDVGAVMAVLGAVVGEFVGAKQGLGYALLQANFNFDIPGLFAALVMLALMGIVAHLVIRLLRRRFVFWERVGREDAK